MPPQTPEEDPLPSSRPRGDTPFDNPSDADLIIRSSDGVDFFVYKFLMSLSSTVFKDMLALPQPNQLEEDMAVVEVAEPSDVLEGLLSALDPRAIIPPRLSINQLKDIFRAIHKYQMDGLRPKLAHRVSQLAASEPLPAYLLAAPFASQETWAADVAYVAARVMLGRSLSSLRTLESYSASMTDQSMATHILRLVEYHNLCGDEAQKVAADLNFSPTGLSSDCSSSHCSRKGVQIFRTMNSTFSWPHWWFDYTDLIGQLLSKRPKMLLHDKDEILSCIRASKHCRVCLQDVATKAKSLVVFLDYNKAVDAKVQSLLNRADLGFQGHRMPFIRPPSPT